MKRVIVYIVAVILFLLGVVFIVVPGPSLVFFLIALTLVSFYQPRARGLLKTVQRLFKESCVLLDKMIDKRKRS